MAWYRWDGEDLLLALLVQPRAARDGWVGPQGDAFKVRITAPPVDGQANEHLIRFLAKAFGVSRADVILLHGASGRRKTLRIHRPTLQPLPVPRP